MVQETRFRLIRRLQWQRAINDPRQEPRNRLPVLPALRRWQSARLRAAFVDFLADPKKRPAAEFFLSDLYGDKDFTGRDRDAAKILPMLSRFLPDSLLRAAADAIELAILSHALDLRMAADLMRRPRPSADISVEEYAGAYRRVGLRRLRRHQIALILKVGHALDAAVQKHGVARLLHAAKLPAKLAGLSELQEFLERGFTAFSALAGAGPFLAEIGRRETAVARALFAGDRQPFA